MKIIDKLNIEQKKQLAGFFSGLAIGWGVAAFINSNSQQNLLIITFDFANMVSALFLSMVILRENKYDK